MTALETKLKAAFRNFLIYVWGRLTLPKPPQIQLEMAEYLQWVYEKSDSRRAIIEAFRGVGKSWITSAFVCWLLLKDPQLKILVVSASKERSDSFSIFTKRLIHELPVLKHLIPRDEQRTSNVAFDVAPAKAAHAPSVKSVGITGQMTGSRANVIIADDVETPKNSQTQVQRDKISELVKEFEAILSPGGTILFLGTPQTEMSLYNTLRHERGYLCRIWPSRYPSHNKLIYYGGALAPSILKVCTEQPERIGTPTEPTRFPDEELEGREKSYGKSGFALQFMLDTTLSDTERYPLKLTDLIVLDVDQTQAPVNVVWSSGAQYALNDVPCVGFTGDRLHGPMMVSDKWADFQGSVMAIDPSGRGQDETGFAIVKMLYGFLYLVETGGLKGGYTPENLQILSMMAKKHNVNMIIVESNFGDGMFTALLKPVLYKVHGCQVEEVRHNIQKERRIIDTLEPVMNQHRLVVDKRLFNMDFNSSDVPAYQLFYQLTRITRDRGSLGHDDRLDALAIAVAYWVEQMARDTDHSEKDHEKDLLEKELEKFMSSFGVGKPGFLGLSRPTSAFGRQSMSGLSKKTFVVKT